MDRVRGRNPNRLRTLRNVFVRAALGLILTLALLELVFRLFFPQPLYAETLAPWGVWHQANASFVHAADGRPEGRLFSGTEFVSHVSYNSLGIRGPEYTAEKPPQTARVVILGDSFGDAIEVEFPDTMGQVLQRELSARKADISLAGNPVPSRITSDPAASVESAIWRRLLSDVARAPLLVATLAASAGGEGARPAFIRSLRIPVVSVQNEAADRAKYRFHYDGHWNVAGNARAAEIIATEILSDGLLRTGRHIDRVEVINLSHAAYDTCQETMLFEGLGRRFEPDLVLVVDSGIDRTDQQLCSVDAAGTLVLHPKEYSFSDRIVRTARTLIRGNSYFFSWLIDRIDALRNPEDRVPIPKV